MTDIAAVIRTVPELPEAACTGRTPLFDLDVHGESNTDRRYRLNRAVAICGQCPAAPACREIADQLDPPPAGVWAGQLRDPSKRAA